MSLDGYMRYFLILMISCSLLGLVGCAPRGETKSVEQVLEDAKARYQEVKPTGNLAANVSSTLTSLTSNMSSIERGIAGLSQSAGEIAEGLTALERHAGYTSRASMAELIGQYRSLAATSSEAESSTAAAAKLLVARTYNLLASELETTQFALN